MNVSAIQERLCIPSPGSGQTFAFFFPLFALTYCFCEQRDIFRKDVNEAGWSTTNLQKGVHVQKVVPGEAGKRDTGKRLKGEWRAPSLAQGIGNDMANGKSCDQNEGQG